MSAFILSYLLFYSMPSRRGRWSSRREVLTESPNVWEIDPSKSVVFLLPFLDPFLGAGVFFALRGIIKSVTLNFLLKDNS